MKLATSAQIRKLDSLAVSDFGMSDEQLMENAAWALYENITRDFSMKNPYAVFCGKGKNGGDGMFFACNVVKMGGKAKIYLCCDDEEKLHPLTKKGLEKAREMNIEVSGFRESVEKDAIIIDALLGIGISGAPEGDIKTAIDIINLYPNKVISVDIPSGLNADNGKYYGSVIHPVATYTLAMEKIGLNLYPGKEICGEKKLLDIGIPKNAEKQLNITCVLADKDFATETLPKRKPDSHKGDYGKIGIIGGSQGMSGSVCLAATAALKAGAGLVYVFVPDDIINTVSIKLTEVIVLKESQIENYLDKLTSIAIGMGHQNNPKAKNILKTVLQKFTGNVVIDADAINILATDTKLLSKKKCKTVLTPHMVEFSRLTKLTLNNINDNKILHAQKYAKEFNSTILLKGAATVITDDSNRIIINSSGNSGMATAGSGDVLSGIIASLLSQINDEFVAPALGAYLHGLSGDLAKEDLTEYCITASDLINYLPKAIKNIINV
ncbi:MAG: NAD(P)H-hydrate dehydratase [Clostridia bacterium]|nr:NAD(P)H-hydrate dehydratase [Clostridia bacterium]